MPLKIAPMFMKSSRRDGFFIYLVAPSFFASLISLGASDELRITTGTEAHFGLARILSSTRSPLAFGRLRSRTTNSAQGTSPPSTLATNLSACSPSLSTIRSHWIPCSSNASRTRITSARLSSTRRMQIDLGALPASVSPFIWDRKGKRGSFSELRLNPDPPACTLDNSLANCEANAGAGKLCRCVETLEYPKDLFLVERIDTNSVVANGNHPLAAPPRCGDVDER